MGKDVKEYVINSDGKLEEVIVNKTENTEELTPKQIIDKTELFQKVDKINKTNLSVINKNDLKINKELIKNPFLYDYDDRIKEQDILSIEEYYVCKGKNYYNFGALFRTKVLWKCTRKKLIKKSLKKWNDEVTNRIEDIKLIGDSRFQDNKNKLTSKVSIVVYLLSLITFVFSIILLNGKLWIFTTPENIFNTLTYVSLAVSIFVLLASILYNRRANFIKKLYSKNKVVFNKNKRDLENEYNKKYKIAYKYYTSGMGRKSRNSPLLLEKIAIGEEKIKKVEEIISESSKKIIISAKKEDSLKVACFFLMLLCIASIGYVVVFAVYEIVLKLILKK